MSSGQVWRGNIEALEWSPNAIVSLTEFIPNVTGVFIPLHLRKQQGGGLQLSAENISNMTVTYLVELMQWSDLIIFDYLTANFDRIVSHIFSLHGDARVMERTTNNLLKQSTDICFLLITRQGLFTDTECLTCGNDIIDYCWVRRVYFAEVQSGVYLSWSAPGTARSCCVNCTARGNR